MKIRKYGKFDKVVFYVHALLCQSPVNLDNYNEFLKIVEHSKQVWNYAKQLADRLDLSKREKKMLRYGVALHDIGKINNVNRLYPEYTGKLKLHRFVGARFIMDYGTVWLKEHRFSKEEIDVICEIIEFHKEGKADCKMACIVAAADKLAHIEAAIAKKKKSLKRIEQLHDKKVRDQALKIAKKQGWRN